MEEKDIKSESEQEEEIPEDINDMKVQELKEALRKRKLPVTGTKAVLVERLSSFINGEPEQKSSKRKAPSKAGGPLKKRKVSTKKRRIRRFWRYS